MDLIVQGGEMKRSLSYSLSALWVVQGFQCECKIYQLPQEMYCGGDRLSDTQTRGPIPFLSCPVQQDFCEKRWLAGCSAWHSSSISHLVQTPATSNNGGHQRYACLHQGGLGLAHSRPVCSLSTKKRHRPSLSLAQQNNLLSWG